VSAPIESRVLRGPDDLETFEWAPGKWFYGPGRDITGMTVFTPTGRVKANWGDTIHHVGRGLYFVGEVDWATARKANARRRAILAPRCEDCGAVTDRAWHEGQTCRTGKGCNRGEAS
jgi:hypothetical protein